MGGSACWSQKWDFEERRAPPVADSHPGIVCAGTRALAGGALEQGSCPGLWGRDTAETKWRLAGRGSHAFLSSHRLSHCPAVLSVRFQTGTEVAPPATTSSFQPTGVRKGEGRGASFKD